jgi:DnaJ-domain-containing protein 1
MEATTKKQRRRAPRKAAGSSVISIKTKDGLGAGKRLTADVVDLIDGGFGVNLRTPLKPGSLVVVGDHIEAQVRWCVQKSDGTFRAGLQNSLLDCYEAMQLSPNADPETIARVYRLLAARYHPDNRESGDSEKFIRLSQAYQILSDPEKRALYDVGYRSASQPRQQERRKRIDGSFRQGRRKGDKLPPSVGALRGWNSALRQPGF